MEDPTNIVNTTPISSDLLCRVVNYIRKCDDSQFDKSLLILTYLLAYLGNFKGG